MAHIVCGPSATDPKIKKAGFTWDEQKTRAHRGPAHIFTDKNGKTWCGRWNPCQINSFWHIRPI